MTPVSSSTESSEVLHGLQAALAQLAAQQRGNGCWEGEVVWCPMILAQYVIAQRILGRQMHERTRAGIVRHFEATRREGTGWGLHAESQPYVFVTTLGYVALRLLGVPPDDQLVGPAREWLLAQPGGVLAIPTWGKFWLSLIGLYEYCGMNPVPPELFLLPRWLPFHPEKLYCHTRYIYLGIAYLYGRRFRVALPETEELRKELFRVPYAQVDFAAHRHNLARTDVYVPPSRGLRRLYDALDALERGRRWVPGSQAVRRRALEACAGRILYEQRASRYQGISPVNGLLNTLALSNRSSTAAASDDLEASIQGLESWRWEDSSEGVRFAGARSNAWDTAFAMQAILEYAPALAEQRENIRRAYRFLRDTQMLEELEGYREQGRDSALGGWCFSDGRHRWPVSDCTAEALSAILAAHQWPGLIPDEDKIPAARVALAVEFILSRQNSDGGFGTYERRRGGRFLEAINPSEMFGQCMTELSYVECTSSAVKALCRFVARGPASGRISQALASACRFLRSRQRPDGSFPGFWGINFSYATLFATEALREAGAPAHDPALQNAARWLTSHQRADGGWGEHYSSCLDGVYREHSESQAVMTSWALLALLDLVGTGPESVTRGIRWLRARQNPDGSWPREAVNGVFFGSAMLDYRLYRMYFPAWTLARYSRIVEGQAR